MIEARDLHKAFRSRAVLRGVNLEIADGETLVIIGRSGCGKSVFLKLLAGLLHPDSGSVRVGGVEWASLRGRELTRMRLRFGVVFQGAALFDSLTIGENVGFALKEHSSFKAAEIRSRVAEALEYVGLPGIEALKPSELSGGMRKRVGVARAICAKPEFVLYDEPTTGLDPINTEVINDLMIGLNKRLKITSVVVSHDMGSVFKVAARIAMMYEGQILCVGKPEEIRRSADPVVKQFISGTLKGPITELDVNKRHSERG